ncbi:MAG TPA: hypothetical protein VF010_12905 [Methylomirabilota bacterium]|nr:hypothetical protein [Methylomirabilota bacterium]
MRPAAALAMGLLLTATSPVLADHERAELAGVRLTTDPKVPVGCTRIGIVRDDSIKDLRRKVVKAGGDTALLSFPADDLERIDAQVFRCPPHTLRPAIPPPPPGPPPPPPPR